MKINYILLLKIVCLEIVYSVVLFFASFFFLWGYFGEGAGSESSSAIICEKIATCIVLLPPLVFNLYKMVIRNGKQNLITYLTAEIIVILFFIYANYKGFI